MLTQKYLSRTYLPLFIVSIILTILAPRTLAFSIPLLGLLSIVLFSFSGQARILLREYLEKVKYFAIAIAVTAVVSLLSVLWSVSPETSIERFVKVLPVLGLGLFAPIAWGGISAKALKYAVIAILAVWSAGAAFVIEELTQNLQVYRIVKGYNQTEWFHPSFLNRQTVFLCLTFFLIYPLTYQIKEKFLSLAFRIFMPILLGGMLFFTESQGCQLAVLMGAIVYGVFCYQSRISWVILKILLVMATLAAPLIGFYGFEIFAEHMKEYEWTQNGYAAERFEIWNFISKRIMENPLYGFGIEATRVMDDFDTQKLYHPESSILHPHNFALQLWIEFGAIGAIGGAAFLWLIVSSIEQLKDRGVQLSCISFLMALLVIAATGYGLWQGWWLALFFMGGSLVNVMLNMYAINRGEVD